jgi:hypothetical protein
MLGGEHGRRQACASGSYFILTTLYFCVCAELAMVSLTLLQMVFGTCEGYRRPAAVHARHVAPNAALL